MAAIESLPQLQEMKVKSARCEKVKLIAENIKTICAVGGNKEKLATFSASIVGILESLLPEHSISERTASCATYQRTKMWTDFHNLRGNTLPAMWRAFLENIGCGDAMEEPLFIQLVNETVFDALLKQKYAYTPREAVTAPSLTLEEENVLRYACGYVGKKLHDRFIKIDGEKAAQFLECIDSMRVDGPTASLLQYTRVWVEKVNRGGLFDVSDNAYNLFVAIEIAMQVTLTNHIHSSYKLSAVESRARKELIVDTVVSDENVLFYWFILAIDIKNEHEGLELLRHITELWLTIRGFSISKCWMEEYKKAAQMQLAQKALRKELKKKKANEE